MRGHQTCWLLPALLFLVPLILTLHHPNALLVKATSSPASPKPGPKVKPTIANGTPSTGATYPWMALLQDSDDYLTCTGVAIAKRLVLTAAHCFYSPENTLSPDVNIANIYIGETDVNGLATATPIAVKTKYIYTGYVNKPPYNNDIALIVLDADYNGVVASLPTATNGNPALASTLRALGYILPAEDVGLSYADMKVVPSTTGCNVPGRYGQICMQATAIGSEFKAPCQGDSGGPLVSTTGSPPTVFGVLSWGVSSTCGGSQYASYTNVAHASCWIKEKAALAGYSNLMACIARPPPPPVPTPSPPPVPSPNPPRRSLTKKKPKKKAPVKKKPKKKAPVKKKKKPTKKKRG